MRRDYLVTFNVPLTIRIENADDVEQAESMALDALDEAGIAYALDPTPFYVGPGNAPWGEAPEEAHDLYTPLDNVATSVAIFKTKD